MTETNKGIPVEFTIPAAELRERGFNIAEDISGALYFTDASGTLTPVLLQNGGELTMTLLLGKRQKLNRHVTDDVAVPSAL